MERQIILRDKKVTYTLRKSKRAKKMSLTVRLDGSVVVTIPHRLREVFAERFINEKKEWLFSKLIPFKQSKGKLIVQNSHENYLKHKEEARKHIKEKVDHFTNKHGLQYNKISIKNQKTCWGSCSWKANLNFNYKILFLPENVQDYVIAHELCHLKELNHSKKFWNHVAKVVPDYLATRKELKRSPVSFY